MSAPGGVRFSTPRFSGAIARGSRRQARGSSRDLAHGRLRRAIPIWTIPGIVVAGVVAALAIASVRVQLIDQGYARANAVEKQRQLEEELRILRARARELRDPARLAHLAKEMGLARPQQVITLEPTSGARRP